MIILQAGLYYSTIVLSFHWNQKDEPISMGVLRFFL